MKKYNAYKYRFHIIKTSTNNSIEYFKEYILEVETKFNNDIRSMADSIKEQTENLSPSEASELEMTLSDNIFVIDSVFVSMHRKSALISIYSFLENSMNILCEHLYKQFSYSVDVKEIKGSGIVRAEFYLDKVCSLTNTDPMFKSQWDMIMRLNKIRNCIVHSDSDIKNSQGTNKLNNIIENDPHLSLKYDRYIEIEKDYLNDNLKNIELYINNLYEMVNQG